MWTKPALILGIPSDISKFNKCFILLDCPKTREKGEEVRAPLLFFADISGIQNMEKAFCACEQRKEKDQRRLCN